MPLGRSQVLGEERDFAAAGDAINTLEGEFLTGIIHSFFQTKGGSVK